MIKDAKCPICRRPADPDHKPFCSQRCAEVDLGRWLTENYKLPVNPVPGETDDTE